MAVSDWVDVPPTTITGTWIGLKRFDSDNAIIAWNTTGDMLISHDEGYRWNGSSPFNSKYIYDICSIDSYVFAVANDGLFISEDSTLHWRWYQINESSYQHMRSVATNGTDIICVGLDTVIKFDIEGRYSINQLLIDFGNAPKLEWNRDSNVFACATQSQLIISSENGGVTWNEFSILSTSGYKIRYLSPNRKLYNFYLGITRDNGTGGFWGVSNCKNDNSVERYSAVNQIPQFSVSGTIADIKVDLDCENVYVCGNQNIRGRYNISTSTWNNVNISKSTNQLLACMPLY